MNILGVDFETNSDKPLTTDITEVGGSLWQGDDTTGYQKVDGTSLLCWEENYPPQSAKIVEITGITDAMLKGSGIPRKVALQDRLFPMLELADVVFAHKKAFDETIMMATSEKLGLTPPKKTWICTLTEFDWPTKFTCHKLSHLAYEHGILVDPRTLHRAENDCDLMMRLITENYKINDVIAFAKESWVYFRADVCGPWEGRGGDGGVQTGIAKQLGFSFEKCRGTEGPSWPKTWVVRKKQRHVEAMLEAISSSASPFRCSRIEGI